MHTLWWFLHIFTNAIVGIDSMQIAQSSNTNGATTGAITGAIGATTYYFFRQWNLWILIPLYDLHAFWQISQMLVRSVVISVVSYNLFNTN
jgi:hypothetical protein